MSSKDDLLLRKTRRFKYISLTVKVNFFYSFFIRQEQEQGLVEDFDNYYNIQYL